MPARLTLYLPDRPARVLPLRDAGELTLGRDAASDVQVDDDRVSRRHARLRGGARGWELADLGSKNGTLVDGSPAGAGRPLGPRSWISLGGVLASFELLSDQESRRESEVHLERWRSTLALRRRIAVAGSLDGLVRGLLDSVVQVSGAERAFILLARGDGELEVAAANGLGAGDLRAADFSGSIGAVERVLATGRAVATSDALADTSLGGRASVARGGIRALVCIPVAALERRLGAIYADSRKPGSAFTELDVEILEALASQAALAIAAARLDEEVRGLLADLPAKLDLPAAARERLRGEIDQAWRRFGGWGRASQAEVTVAGGGSGGAGAIGGAGEGGAAGGAEAARAVGGRSEPWTISAASVAGAAGGAEAAREGDGDGPAGAAATADRTARSGAAPAPLLWSDLRATHAGAKRGAMANAGARAGGGT
jgi:pSer/pThr/pTyr-binding forkhead associated (FHA) protein